MKLFAAPLQGYTDAAWRKFHAAVYGSGIDCYFTPFVRLEKGEVRRRDLADTLSPLNEGVNVVPQIIFKDTSEFRMLADTLVREGYGKIDLNLGCPFAPQVKKGRGAGALRGDLLEEIATVMADEYGEVDFSVKMRLGVADAGEWRDVMPIVNSMKLGHVAVHPRTAVQQYSGELDLDNFARLAVSCRHPVVFNGLLASIGDMEAVLAKFPQIYGLMLGRGLLGRPSLAAEFAGCEMSPSHRRDLLMRFHELMFAHYSSRLAGDAQLLMKMKSFWEYMEPEIGRKTLKAIRKASSVAAYQSSIGKMA